MTKRKARAVSNVPGEVWLFDPDGADLGFVSVADAEDRAERAGLDLVRLDQLSSPPRYGLRHAAEYARDDARRARMARGGEPKEIRVRVVAGAADVETRRRLAVSSLQAGYRVKLRVEHDAGKRIDPVPARALLDSLARSLEHHGRPEAKPQAEKGGISVILAPLP